MGSKPKIYILNHRVYLSTPVYSQWVHAFSMIFRTSPVSYEVTGCLYFYHRNLSNAYIHSHFRHFHHIFTLLQSYVWAVPLWRRRLLRGFTLTLTVVEGNRLPRRMLSAFLRLLAELQCSDRRFQLVNVYNYSLREERKPAGESAQTSSPGTKQKSVKIKIHES